MTGPSHSDIYEKVGTLNGELRGVHGQLSKMHETLQRIEARLAKIENRESARKGAMAALAVVWSVLTLAAGWLVQHIWK